MNISLSQAQGRVPITIIKLEGQLDGQTYHGLISTTREAYAQGKRDFIVDMTDLSYLSSAGLVALHSMAMMARGEELPNPEHGWSALKTMPKSSSSAKQTHLKLLNPRAEIKSVLDMVGFSTAFDIFASLDDAVNSF